MKRILKYFGLAVLAIFVLLALFAPRHFEIQREITVDRPNKEVYREARFLDRHDEWSAWMKLDPALVKKVETGRDGQVGYIVSWDSKNEEVGTAQQEITNLVEHSLFQTTIRFQRPLKADFVSSLRLTPLNDHQTRATMIMEEDIPFPSSIVSFIVNIGLNRQQKIKDRMDESLKGMKAFIEKTTPRATVQVERLIKAPREQVWEAWTEAEHVKSWWGPKGFTSSNPRNEFFVPGTYLYDMRSPEGKVIWRSGLYKQIVEKESIVALESFADENGRLIPASRYELGDGWPMETQITVRFEDAKGGTKLTLTQEDVPEGAAAALVEGSWKQSFDKLVKTIEALRKPAKKKKASS